MGRMHPVRVLSGSERSLAGSVHSPSCRP